MKIIKNTILTAIWLVVGIFATAWIALHIPVVQRGAGSIVAELIAEKIGSKVEIGRVDIGFPNHLVVDGLKIYDQQGRSMLAVSRLSAGVGIIDLINGHIRISSAQLFGPRIHLIQSVEGGPLNCQFVIDSLSSKDKSQPSKLDLKINSFIIRRGTLSFRQTFKAPRRSGIDLADLEISKISSHIVLRELTPSCLDMRLKRLSLYEKSGLDIRNLSFLLHADSTSTLLSQFQLDLPKSHLSIDSIKATYRTEQGHLLMPTLKYQGEIKQSNIRLSDMTFVVPELAGNKHTVALKLRAEGTSTTLNVRQLSLTSDELIDLAAQGDITHRANNLDWYADINSLTLNCPEAALIANDILKRDIAGELPQRLGIVTLKGDASGGSDRLGLNMNLTTSVGNVKLAFNKQNKKIDATLSTEQLDIASLTAQNQLGTAAGNISLQGNIGAKASAKADISHIDLKGYTLRNINIEATTDRLDTKNLGPSNINLVVADAALDATINALWTGSNSNGIECQADVAHINPQKLALTNKWNDADFAFKLKAKTDRPSIHGNWDFNIDDLTMSGTENNYYLHQLQLSSVVDKDTRRLTLDSDFGHAEMQGRIDLTRLKESMVAIIADKLPTMPGLPAGPYSRTNDFSFRIHLDESLWMQALLNIPLELKAPFDAAGEVSDAAGHVYADISAPSLCYDETFYQNVDVKISSPMGALVADAGIDKVMSNGKNFRWEAHAKAIDNRLTGFINFDNHSSRLVKGLLNIDAGFDYNAVGETEANIKIGQSRINFGDSLWTVEPSEINYSKKNLRINDFAIRHNRQYIMLSGSGTTQHSDTIEALLKDVDISYIMNLIDFHSVEFDGRATGRATLAGLFSREPKAETRLTVRNFLFQRGNMGTLQAHATYNNELQQIDIDALCNDDGLYQTAYEAIPLHRRTLINGFIAPQRGDIDLRFVADNTRLEFMQDFCDSFLSYVDCIGRGNIRLGGTLKKLELTGDVSVDGQIGVSSLNTDYTLKNAKATLTHNRIEFLSDTIRDRDGHIGVVTGGVDHTNLKKFAYDVNIDADHLLSYDTHDFGEFSFYGTAYATGNCRIQGKSGELNIDVNAIPEEGSILVYNVATPEALTERDFVTWHDASKKEETKPNDDYEEQDSKKEDDDFTTNMRFNFVTTVYPNATLRLIMDPLSGDYIDLMGTGSLRCQYYNKGTFDVYGNYNIDHGLYKLTIQNVIRRDFRFLSGGTISFGGDPFAAAINLKAQYTLNGVSLAGLGLGNTFGSNNVRVDCLMNITGTAGAPRVDFSLDMPTLNAEARKMVYSLINSTEDMNNQVLYLLAVGSFYQQGTNNAASNPGQPNQTSLAMQSILSGTISQQINTLLAGVVKNSNWQFGANISTGDEGFNNAEYEGTLSGQLFNNRLIFDGQFGYRDNANATSSFIGDFDLKYLLTPNGNIAVRVYNQSNDRYFTRSTLNTQGIGLILKHDFNKLFPLWKTKKQKK